MKPDEFVLLLMVAQGWWARDAGAYLGIPPKRVYYLCAIKWPRKDWYEYGVTHDLGWLTAAGKERVAELVAA